MQHVIGFSPRDGFRRSMRKENAFAREIVAIDPEKRESVVTLRIYRTESRAYACVWIGEARGSGYAGGGGYHKPSAAAAEAFKAAGVTLAQDIDARGDVAMRDAVEAIARHIGTPSPIIHEAHA